jgi:hypothetical protein
MRKNLTFDNLEDWIIDIEQKARKDIEELDARKDIDEKLIRQVKATRSGKLLGMKDLRLRIKNETGRKLKEAWEK